MKMIGKLLFIVSITVTLYITLSCSNNDIEADAFGNFEADEIIISAQMQGELLFFNIEEGQKVKKDELVGIIDTTEVFLQKDQLYAQQELLKAKRLNVISQIDVQKEQVKNLVREKKRLEKLLSDHAATQQQFDDIVGKIQVAESQIKTTETQFQSIKAEKAVLKSQLKQVEDKLKKCKIINPTNGIVLEKYCNENELVNTGKSLYKLADISELELKVYVSGGQLPGIKLGDEVQVIVDKNHDEIQEFNGKVSWISQEVEFTPKIIQTREERVNMVYAVKIRVKNDGTIKIGMPGEVVFSKEKE